MKIVFLLLLVTCFSVGAEKQVDIYDLGERYFQTVGNEDSIPLGVITALSQDKQGFIWIGTQKGLVRYDGYRFRLFNYDSQNSQSIGGDFVSTIWSAHDGRVWVGTRHDGVSVFDPNTETFKRYQFSINNRQGLSDNYITAILGDTDDTVWIGTKQGLDRLNFKTQQIEHFSHSPNNPISINNSQIGALLFDNNKRLLVGTNNGLSRFYKETSSFKAIYSDNKVEGSLFNQPVNKLFLAKDGKIWIGTEGNGAAVIDNQGLFHRIESDPNQNILENDQQTILKLNHLMIYDIVQPNEKEIWMATYGGGINIFDPKTMQVTEHLKHDISVASSINHDSIGAMLLDTSGILWVGTWGNGLNSFNTNNIAFKTLRYSPSKNNSLSYSDTISALETQNGDIWIGTRGKGVDIFRPNNGFIEGLNKNKESIPLVLQQGYISALMQAKNGIIWIGTRHSGLFQYNLETKKLIAYSTENGLSHNDIKRLLEDTDGKIWVGTGSSLDRLDPNTGIFEHFVTKDSPYTTILSRLNTLAKLPDGTLYAGASNGLYQHTPGDVYLTKTTHNEKKNNSLSHNTVLGLFVDEKNELWVSTQQGLDKLVHWDSINSQFESINSRLGLPGQALWANLQKDDQQRIWDGQSIIDLKSNQRRELTKADGVDIGVNWYSGYEKTQKGLLLYAGAKGLLVIKPELFQEWTFQPNLVITQLMVNGKSKPIGSLNELKLEANMKSFSVEFAALDFSDPMKNQYAYKLDGYDPDWNFISAENRTASYTNLAPGDYKLKVKATNRRGLWSNKLINLSITILPKWYQTIAFKIVIILLSMSLLYFIYFLRIRQLNRHKEDLRLEVEQRTAELKLSNQSISTLSDIGNEISSTLDLDKILKTVYFHVNQMMDANVFCIGFYEEETEQIIFKLTIERGIQLPEFTVSMKDKQRLAVWCVENQKPVIINDFEKDKPKYFADAPYIAPQSGEETASVIYWPLIVGGKTIGAITVQSFQQNAYTKHHQKIIHTLASTTAVAMDNANAYLHAQQAAEIKSAFLANMSHEIRTPMHGILGMTKLIAETNLNLEQKEYVKNIGISANALLNVINDILDFSKIEAGKMPIEQKPFSLTQLLNNMSVIVDTIAENKGLVFDYQISSETPSDFIGDASRINQILLNLCSNAVKFTEQGKINVQVIGRQLIQNQSTNSDSDSDLSEHLTPKYQLTIAVSDQGIGIPKDVLPKLFHSFSQADTSTTRKYGGTGLGLAISRQLARKMNGDISVDSKIGVGSCFTLSIKLASYQPIKINSEKTKSLQNAPILIVENDPVHAQIIKEKLLLLGLKNTIINSNDLEIASKNHNPNSHLALLAWDDNIEQNISTIKQIKQHYHLSSSNIVAYSDYKIHSIMKSAAQLGIETILQKPLSFLELEQTLTSVYASDPKRLDETKMPLDGLKILVAEDNKINQLIAKKLLTSKGANVDVVENGLEAIDRVNSFDYDVVLMDIQMPELDGTEATKIIRQNPQFKFLPIIAMTANVLENDVNKYKTYGINAHVSKPINTKDLIDKILEQIKLNQHLVNL